MSPASMRFALQVGPRRTRLRARPLPRPGSGEVLVRVEACGVCASELPAWRSPERIDAKGLGHEPVGTVVSVGHGVSNLEVGDRVTGRFGPAFAEYAVATHETLVRVPAGVGYEAVLGEPMGCLVEAVRRMRLRPADRVAIVGLGFMGLAALQLSRLSTPAWTLGVDPRADARASALALGVDEALSPEEVPLGYRSLAMAHWDHVEAFDLVVEASGTQAGLTLAGELVRGHGRLAIVGYHQEGTRSVDLAMWNWKAIDVVNAHVRRMSLLTDAIERALELAAGGYLDLGRMVTHRLTLDRLDEAFGLLERKPSGFIKAVILMDDERV
jgi:L-iditol 2-dehydrogenase